MKKLLKIIFLIIALVAGVRGGLYFFKSFNTPDGPLPLWNYSVEEKWFDNRNQSCKDFKNLWGTKYEYDNTFDEIKYCLVVREKCLNTSISEKGEIDRGCIIEVRKDFGLRNK